MSNWDLFMAFYGSRASQDCAHCVCSHGRLNCQGKIILIKESQEMQSCGIVTRLSHDSL